MKKKLFKYIKFFICMAIIFSLVAPSYASLSASDGSAFVTKAEFDSALADFNSRLTTFEAGINSKIDSQVTSYLDRNGIWSKKEQVLANFSYKNLYLYYPLAAYDLYGSGGTTHSQKYYVNGSESTRYFTGAINIKPSISNSHEWIIVDELNKSGMFVATSAFTAIAGSGSNTYDPDNFLDDNTMHTYNQSKLTFADTALGKWNNQNKNKTTNFDSLLIYRNDTNVMNSGLKYAQYYTFGYITWFTSVMSFNIYFYENDELRCVINPIKQVLDSRKMWVQSDSYNSYIGMSIDSAVQPTPYVTQFFVQKGNKLKIKMALEWTGRLGDGYAWFISSYDGGTTSSTVDGKHRPEWWTALQILENGVY